MLRTRNPFLFYLLLFAILLGMLSVGYRRALAQATPQPVAVVSVKPGNENYVNIRSGPSPEYALLGTLTMGQTAQAIGRSPGGDWVEILFPSGPEGVGWVYSWLVDVDGVLPVLQIPPTATPRVTPTIDKTLAAQFIREQPPTRLPTYTPPPPLVYPTFSAVTAAPSSGGANFIYVMVFLAAIGLLGFFVSLIRK